MENHAQKKFKGNIVLASHNVMNFGRPSRKDDLVSLFYLLLQLMNDFDIIKIGTSNLT